jgi:hypothetical protein
MQLRFDVHCFHQCPVSVLVCVFGDSD